MGRGESKTTGGVTRLNLSGDNIDLSGMPLEYGGKDSEVTGTARQNAERFENANRGSELEHEMALDENGNIIEEKQGEEGRVKLSLNAQFNAKTITHNHPKGGGVLGGTFSVADIAQLDGKTMTVRAAAKEGTYSISRTPKYDIRALVGYQKAISAASKALSKREDALYKQWHSNKLSTGEYGKRMSRAQNRFYINMHNWLLAHQSEYGYKYTLER